MSAALAISDIAPTIDGYPGDIDALLGRLVRYFEDSETASQDARNWAERCRDYYDGKQLTPEEMEALRARKQPPVVNNKIAEKIDLLCGMERRGRSDPKAYPRTPMEEERADVATQCLRYVSDDNRFDVIRSSVYKNMLIEGFGGAEVIVEPEPMSQSAALGGTSLSQPAPGYNVKINYLQWDRMFYDPHSQHPGFADARYKGLVIWMDREEAIATYPGSDDIIGATLSAVSANTYEDKPRTYWGDRQRRRVRVVQMEWKEGVSGWWCATFTQGGFLEGPMPSPYLDRHDRPDDTLVMRSAFIDRENNRYGIVARYLSLQDEINKRRSKLLHSVNVNRIIREHGAVDDPDLARREASKPDGDIVVNPGFKFEIQKDQAEIRAQYELLQDSVAQMNGQGPNASMSGKDPREQSGRAILAQQAGGMVEAEPLADELRQFNHKVWEKAWLRIRQFWTGPKMIRVTDDNRNAKYIGINRPVTLQEELQNLPPPQAQMAAQRLRLMGPTDPRLQMVVRVENDLDDMDVDITVEEGPDTPNMQYEQFDSLMRLPPQILAQFPPQLIIQMSQLRDKQNLIKMLDEHQQQQAQAQQQQHAAQQAMLQAQVADKQAQAADRQASAVAKLHGVAVEHAQATQPQTTVQVEHAPPMPPTGPDQAFPAQV